MTAVSKFKTGKIKDFLVTLLTSGKYSGIQDEKDMDAVIRLIVLNITYTFTSVLIIGIGVGDMRSGLVNQGLLELIIGFLIFLNLMLLRTELPFIIGGFIVIAVYGIFCGLSIFTKSDVMNLNCVWIFSFPLMSIFTLGLAMGFVPAFLLFGVAIAGTFVPGLNQQNYTLHEALLICGVYFFVLCITVIYEYVRSIKDTWLTRQDSYMNMVFKNSPDIILLLDKNGDLVYCADVFLQKTHIVTFEELRKTHYTDFFSLFSTSTELEEIIGFFRAAKTEKKPVVFERDMDIGRDNNSRHYEIHYTPMYDNTGTFQGAFILFHDMTEIFEAKIRTEQASMAKSNFLATMSHEIRTPLNAIIGMTTIANTTDEAERKAYCLSQISSASTHLLGIINDILDMSKIEEGKFELSLSDFELTAMVMKIINFFDFRISEKEQKFTYSIDPRIPPRIIADEQRFTQIITNLLANAVKFTPHLGKINLDIKRIDNGEEADFCRLEMRVSDTGIGISKEQQVKLFQSFVQVDSSISRRFGGTGLGLAITKKIVEMMNGEISIESEIDKGSTFIFSVTVEVSKQVSAVAQTSAQAPGIGAEEAPESARDAGTGENSSVDYSSKHVLLVEDVEINREIVLTILEDFKVKVIEAEDGQQAVDHFFAAPDQIDLIFMDIHMPGVDGYEATKMIRSFDHPCAKTVPIIAMTANVFKEDVEKCMAAGMNGHIGKPLDFDEVTGVLKQYLEK